MSYTCLLEQGGGILGGVLLGHTPVCAVEINPYCRQVLLQRQRDGILPRFPIWDDAITFPAEEWTGRVDIVCGGDPCQGNSNAARHGVPAQSLGATFLSIVQRVQPAAVLRENPFTVRRDAPWPAWKFRDALEDLGFAAIIVKLGACCVGASHRKMRSWVIGVSESQRPGLEGHVRQIMERASHWGPDSHPARPDRGCPPPRVCRATDAVAHRMDRLKAIGNGQVPGVVARAWSSLAG